MIRGGAVVLGTSDAARAVRFYIETLGMKLVREAGDGPVIDAGEGFQLELRPGAAVADVLLYPKVPIADTIAILENRGVTFATTDTGTAIVARFQDPDGNSLSLFQTK